MNDLTAPKLLELAKLEGFTTPLDLIEAFIMDSIVPAICINECCNATSDLEPDQREGFCEACGTSSLQSALVIAGLI